jgi:hypothetical protein
MKGDRYGEAELRAEQDKAAAIVDAAADEAGSALPPVEAIASGGYSALPAGPEQSPEALLKSIVRAASALNSYGDTDPANVARLTGLELGLDAKGQRHGAQGALGKGRYEVAVWKPYPRDPSYLIELRVKPPEVCELSFAAMKAVMVAAGFRVSKSARGHDPLVSFDRAAHGGLGVYVIASTDSHDAPNCVSVVTLKMEPRDG